MKKIVGTFTEPQLAIIDAVYNVIKKSNKVVHAFVVSNTEGYDFIDFHIIAGEFRKTNPHFIELCLAGDKVYRTNMTMHDVRSINRGIEEITA